LVETYWIVKAMVAQAVEKKQERKRGYLACCQNVRREV
jgi:hypothetical protein